MGTGYYTVPEAARLLRIAPLSIRRWLGGYSYNDDAGRVQMPPLWEPQIGPFEGQLQLGFRDLIELRFVKAFLQAGLGLKTIRACMDLARDCVEDDRPFSTRRFRTDGKTIFLEAAEKSGKSELLDLKSRQYVIPRVIERSFKDLDIEHDAVTRWRPFHGKTSIVIDPRRAFGQPVAAKSGVPTVALADAVAAEGSADRVASLFEVSAAVVRDAVSFEHSLRAA